MLQYLLKSTDVILRCRLPIATVGSDGNQTPNSDDMIDTFRTILEYHDFESTSSESDGGSVLANLAFNTCKVMKSSAMPILWLLQNFCTYLPPDRRTGYYLLACVFFNHGSLTFNSELLSSIISFYTPAQRKFFLSQCCGAVKCMRCCYSSERVLEEMLRHTGCLKNGALTFSSQYIKLGLVMTLNAMKTSWSFFVWRSLLNKFHLDTSSFVERQMRVRSTDNHKGWNTQTLKVLFGYEFKPVRGYVNEYSHCQNPRLAFQFKELWWCKNVERIRRGLAPHRQPKKICWAESEDSFEDYSTHIVNEEGINALNPCISDPHAVEPDDYPDMPSESLFQDEEPDFQHYFVDKNGLTAETDPSQIWDEDSAWTALKVPLG